MNVKKIAVICAGAMGNGIAQVGIMSEYTVSMHDVEQRCSCYKKKSVKGVCNEQDTKIGRE